MYGVLLVMLLAVLLAINGHQTFEYDTLRSEVTTLRKSVSSLNAELDQIRKQQDGINDELMAIRKERQSGHTFPVIKSDKIDEESQETHGKMNLLHRRSVYTPSFHLPRNISRGAKGEKGETGIQGLKGLTGPKGESGIQGPIGPKGDTGPAGSIGPKGNTGPAGSIGLKGDTGPAGSIGLKGDTGPAGSIGLKGDTGPAGSIGLKGDTGPAGSIGPKGDTGPAGPIGLKGDSGPKGTYRKIAFGAHPNDRITRIVHRKPIVFQVTVLNLGSDYNPDTGVFRCSEAGVYMFTWSIQINAGHALVTMLIINGQERGFQFVGSSVNDTSSASSTVITMLDVGDIVYITAYTPTPGTVIGILSSSFSGVLLN